jgi:hypothetical protein
MSDASRQLVVQVEGAPGKAERLLRIEPLGAGRVRVHEWSSDAGEHAARELDAASALAELERLHAEHRRLGVEMYEVRRWFAGR